ncbi:MAG: hypothetical protein NDJ90_09960 [Oligoflexia bacterium]|nr:hypothetical protein [Oligoflexia bacterium]
MNRESPDLHAWLKVIQATQAELRELLLFGELSPSLRLYASTIKAFLNYDVEALESCVTEAAAHTHAFQALPLLIRIRRDLRLRQIDAKSVEELTHVAATFDFLRGEALFVAAMGYESILDHARAKALYREASALFRNVGADRKAVKSALNCVVSESRLFSEKKLMADYHFLYKEAKRVGEFGTAGVCLLNISREYQKLGAFSAALKYCNRALALHQKELGTITYFLTLAHRCHLLFQLDRRHEALLDHEQCQNCEFPQVQAALQVVEKLISGEQGQVRDIPVESGLEKHLTPTWKERLLGIQSETRRPELGALENKVIELLSEKPSEKWELMDALYGTALSADTREARLKALIFRLRKKRPGLILFKDGKYLISDGVFLSDSA